MGLNIDIYGKKDFFYKKDKNQMTGMLLCEIFIKTSWGGELEMYSKY